MHDTDSEDDVILLELADDPAKAFSGRLLGAAALCFFCAVVFFIISGAFRSDEQRHAGDALREDALSPAAALAARRQEELIQLRIAEAERKAREKAEFMAEFGERIRNAKGSHRLNPETLPRLSRTQLDRQHEHAFSVEDSIYRSEEYQQLALRERLEQPITLMSFGCFEEILHGLSERTGIPFEFSFPELRAEGISRIGHVDFPIQRRTIAAALFELLRQHNPHPVAGPNDPDMLLVFVIAPDEESIIVTTRHAAAKRGELHNQFVLAN